MNAPRSRALARLDAAIAAARGPVDEACLMAERAGLLARLGHREQGRDILGALRERQAQLVHPALSAWLALAEGMAEHDRAPCDLARDRIRRAHALSVASRDRPLIAISAAWQAQADHDHGDLPSMARHLAESLQEAAADHHAAQARACLVAAQSYHEAARTDLATRWYQRAREHAVADGDEATLGALMLNRAWIGGHQVRLASIFTAGAGGADAAAVREAMLTAEASRNFESHLGRQPLRASRAELIHAQLLLVQGDAGGALARLQSVLRGAAAQGLPLMSPVLQADMAWCKACLGRRDEALAEARAAEQGITDDCGEEARAATQGRLAQLHAALGSPDAARHHEAAQAHHAALRLRQHHIVQVLDDALRQVPGLE